MSRETVVTVGGQEFTVEISADGEVLVNGVARQVDLQRVGEANLYSVLVEGESYDVFVREVDGEFTVDLGEASFDVNIRGAGSPVKSRCRDDLLGDSDTIQIKAPMPGMVVDVIAKEQQGVAPGDVLVVLESMKMQNELRAPAAGVIDAVEVRAGDRVEQHQVLVTIGLAG